MLQTEPESFSTVLSLLTLFITQSQGDCLTCNSCDNRNTANRANYTSIIKQGVYLIRSDIASWKTISKWYTANTDDLTPNAHVTYLCLKYVYKISLQNQMTRYYLGVDSSYHSWWEWAFILVINRHVYIHPCISQCLTSTTMNPASCRWRFCMAKRPSRSLLLRQKLGNSQATNAILKNRQSQLTNLEIISVCELRTRLSL